MKNITSALLLATALLVLNGCGDSGGSSSSYGGAVAYSVDCTTGPVCENASSIKQDTSGKSQYMTCVWWGATYEDKIDAHVTVNFSKPGSGCWQEDGVVVTGGKNVATDSGTASSGNSTSGT